MSECCRHLSCLFAVLLLASRLYSAEQLRVGAAAIDVTPQKYPVLINGGMTSGSAEGATTPIHARAIVLEQGTEKIAIDRSNLLCN